MEGFITAAKHVPAPWLFTPTDKSFGRRRLRSLSKGLLGYYDYNFSRYGFYKKNNKLFKLDRSYFYNLPMVPFFRNKKLAIDVTTENAFNLFSKFNQEVYGHAYSLPLTSRCTFEGVVPYMKHYPKQQFDYGDKDFLDFLDTHEHHKPSSREYLLNYMAMPGWTSAHQDLLGFTKPIEHEITRTDIAEALTILKDLPLPKLEKPTIHQIMKEHVNDVSYSGILTSALAGKTKKDSLKFSVAVAEHLFKKTGARYTVDTSLKTIGSREREVKTKNWYEPTRSRAIIQEESPISQLKQIYFRPITNYFKKKNEKWEHKIGVGGLLTGLQGQYFYDRFYGHENTFQVTMDGSRHDQNVCKELLLGAFSILRACFPKGGDVDRHFFFFASGHIYKRILLNDGLVYRIEGGIQTGDPATSLINTFVMLLEKTILYKKLGIEQPKDSVYYGDDQFELFNNKVEFPSDFEELSKKLIGITQKDVVIKESASDFSWDFSKEPSFLQIFFNKGSPLRSSERMFDKMLYMDPKVRDCYDMKIEAVMSMAYTSFGNPYVFELISDYIKFLSGKYGVNSLDYIEKMYMRVMKVYCGSIRITDLFNARGEFGYVRKKKYVLPYSDYEMTKTFRLLPLNNYVGIILGNSTGRNRKIVRGLISKHKLFNAKNMNYFCAALDHYYFMKIKTTRSRLRVVHRRPTCL